MIYRAFSSTTLPLHGLKSCTGPQGNHILLLLNPQSTALSLRKLCPGTLICCRSRKNAPPASLCFIWTHFRRISGWFSRCKWTKCRWVSQLLMLVKRHVNELFKCIYDLVCESDKRNRFQIWIPSNSTKIPSMTDVVARTQTCLDSTMGSG